MKYILKYILPLISMTIATPVLVAQDYGKEKATPVPTASIPLTAEQEAALRAVDVRIAGVEALITKVDDTEYKAAVVGAVADFKKRRAALGKNFDQGLYESLMHSVISRYQVVALWLAPPRLPGPVSRPAPVEKSAAPEKKTTETKPASP